MADKSYETILVENVDGICWVTMNRPDVLNAANDTMMRELNDAFFEFDADDSLHVAILRGAGRAFSSGADVRQRQLRSKEEMRRLGGPAGRGATVEFFTNSVNWKPIIAAVHGYAVGFGFGLAMRCDIVIAAEGTKFQNTETQRGVGGGNHWAPAWHWSGDRFATEVSLTARLFTAEESLTHGMVNAVLPYEEIYGQAEQLAREIMKNPPLSVRATVRPIRWSLETLQRDIAYYTQGLKLHLTDDYRESASAFMEKREGKFKGA